MREIRRPSGREGEVAMGARSQHRGTQARRGWHATCAVAVTAAVALAGCGRSNANPGSKKLSATREFGFTDEEFTAHVEKAQAAIATCMKRAGFEYVPVDVATIEEAQKHVRTEPGYTRLSYKQKWGYGVTTKFDHAVRDVEMGPQNLRIFNALSPADQTAYLHTLYGEKPRETFTFAFDEEDFSRSEGCVREAAEATFTKVQVRGDYVNPKDVLFEKNPKVIAATKKWTQCMHQHGYDDYEDQDEAIDEFAKRFDALTKGDDPTTLTGDRLTALQEMQQEEIKFSLADVDCEMKYTDEPFRKAEIEIWGHPVSTP